MESLKTQAFNSIEELYSSITASCAYPFPCFWSVQEWEEEVAKLVVIFWSVVQPMWNTEIAILHLHLAADFKVQELHAVPQTIPVPLLNATLTQ